MVERSETEERSVRGDPTSAPCGYANATNVTASGYDVTIQFMRDYPSFESIAASREVVAILSLSHGQAWTMAHLILKVLEAVVNESGPFAVPKDVLERAGLTDDFAAFLEGVH